MLKRSRVELYKMRDDDKTGKEKFKISSVGTYCFKEMKYSVHLWAGFWINNKIIVCETDLGDQ